MIEREQVKRCVERLFSAFETEKELHDELQKAGHKVLTDGRLKFILSVDDKYRLWRGQTSSGLPIKGLEISDYGRTLLELCIGESASRTVKYRIQTKQTEGGEALFGEYGFTDIKIHHFASELWCKKSEPWTVEEVVERHNSPAGLHHLVEAMNRVRSWHDSIVRATGYLDELNRFIADKYVEMKRIEAQYIRELEETFGKDLVSDVRPKRYRIRVEEVDE